jgi:hypothetical protein
MPYIGNPAAAKYEAVVKQDLTGNGGTSYTLSQAVTNQNEIEVFVNNVRQEPNVAYTASGTSLTMTGNVLSTDDFYVVFQGKAVQTVNPPDSSVGTAKIQDSSVSTAKIANGAVTDAKIDTMAASKLTGAMPAIDGSALTGIESGVKQVVSHVTDATTYFERNSTANTYQLLNTTNASDGTSHMSVTITPSSTSSKIMIMLNMNWALDGGDVYNTIFALDRSGTLLLPSNYGTNRRPAIAVPTPMAGTSSAATYLHTQYMLYVDEPTTTSARTYTVAYASTSNTTAGRLWLNRTDNDADATNTERGISTMVAQEI